MAVFFLRKQIVVVGYTGDKPPLEILDGGLELLPGDVSVPLLGVGQGEFGVHVGAVFVNHDFEAFAVAFQIIKIG